MQLKTVDNVKQSRAKNVIEPQTSNLLQFALPPVTEQTAGFVDAEAVNDEPRELDENAQAEQYRGAPDGKGKAYDPAMHIYPPEQTPTGRWRKKSKAQQTQAAVEGVKPQAAYRGEADKFAQIYAQLHAIPFGSDGRLIDKTELVPLIDDLTRYMEENGHRSISPGWSVAISAALYSVGVCQREPNMAKLKRWFGGTWQSIKMFFGGKRRQAETVTEKPMDNKRPEASETWKGNGDKKPNAAPYDTTGGF